LEVRRLFSPDRGRSPKGGEGERSITEEGDPRRKVIASTEERERRTSGRD